MSSSGVADELRHEVLIRDDNRCRGCGDGAASLHLHHIRPNGPDVGENLVTLCPGCHRQLHERFDVDEYHPELLETLGEWGPADEAVLDLLREGRVTAPYAAEEADYSLQYVRDVLARLVEHDHVRKVHTGLYELVSDPREETDV